MQQKAIHYLLFSNLFYGICAVALAIENNLQLGLPLNHVLWYLVTGLGTTYFYNLSYTQDPNPRPGNQRAAWLHTHHIWMRNLQNLLLAAWVAMGMLYIYFFGERVHLLSLFHWLALAGTLVVASLYYGISFPGKLRWQLRKYGWLKPFIIGWVWASVVSLLPLVALMLEQGFSLNPGPLLGWFFLKNWMFIAVLCIMFDIKDYAADHNQQLKTFVVQVGLRQTIHTIIIPLVLAGMGAYLLFVWYQGYQPGRIAFNFIPFAALLAVAYSLQKRRPIVYYLLVIDGLMLLKAACGIAGVLMLKYA